VAGVLQVALGGALGLHSSPVTPRHFASTFVLRGRRATGCTWWRAWSPFIAGDAAALCMAGVALGDIHLHHLFLSHHLSQTTLSHTTLFYFLILHHLLCLSFLPRPRYNIWCSLLEEVALWGFPVLQFWRNQALFGTKFNDILSQQHSHTFHLAQVLNQEPAEQKPCSTPGPFCRTAAQVQELMSDTPVGPLKARLPI